MPVLPGICVYLNSKRSVSYSLLIACVLAIALCGCGPSYENSGTESLVSPVTSASIDAPLKHKTDDFIKAVQSGEFSKASSFLSSDLKKKMSVSQLATMTSDGALKPIATATRIKFEPEYVNEKKNRATLRLGFDSKDGKGYRMNFVFEQNDGNWKIGTIVPPAKYEPAARAGGEASSAAK